MPKKENKYISNKNYALYALGILILLLFYLSYVIIKPFFMPFLIAGILAIMFYPVRKWFDKYVSNVSASSIITVIIVILLIAIPTIIMGTLFLKESKNLYQTISETVTENNASITNYDCTNTTKIANKIICGSISYVSQSGYLNDYLDLKFVTQKFLNFWITEISNIILSIPIFLINLAIMIFILYYLLKDGPRLIEIMYKLIPLKKQDHDEISKQINDVLTGIIFGTIIIGIYQGLMAMFGFYLFGIDAFVFFGVLMLFFAMIPYVGPGVIYFPVTLIMIITGFATNDSNLILRGFGLLAFCLIFVSSVDNLYRPKLISDKAKVHPLLIFLGALGGIKAFGILGVFFGPLILAVFWTILKIIRKEIN